MGVTSNYSFPVPVATDLVKDGWDAINDLGVAVDTAMNTALGTKKAGMVLLNTTSFSAVSSFSFPNDTFTSTYRNYMLVMKFITSSNVPTVSWRGRIAGTDTTLTNYNQQNVYFDSTAVTSARSASQSSGSICFPGNPGVGSTSYIYGPKLTEGTGVVTNAVNYITDNSILSSFYVSAYDLTTSFDSITILVSTGTLTGEAQMYGLAV